MTEPIDLLPVTQGCNCGAQPPCPYNETVIFRREGTFYPVVGTACEDWSYHAYLNPGTLEIQKPDGACIWREGEDV